MWVHLYLKGTFTWREFDWERAHLCGKRGTSLHLAEKGLQGGCFTTLSQEKHLEGRKSTLVGTKKEGNP